MESAHLVSPSGERWSGGYAAPSLLRLLPGGGPLAGVAEGRTHLADRFYRAVSRHRTALGRAVTGGAKRRADELIGERSSSPEAV